jgi:large subunit ribosomal protein L13
MIVIDAENLILGRLATFAAKQSLLGQEVRVINVEKAVVSGNKKTTLNEVRQDMDRGTPAKGPFIPTKADRYVRRVIRGMLPYKQPKGAEAFKRVLCYVGVPEEFKEAETVDLPSAKVDKLPTLKYTQIKNILSCA